MYIVGKLESKTKKEDNFWPIPVHRRALQKNACPNRKNPIKSSKKCPIGTVLGSLERH